MNDQRHPHRLEAATRQLGSSRGSRGRQGGAGDVGEIDAGLFKHRAVGEHATAAAAAFLPLPAILDKTRFPVGLLQPGANSLLQCQQVLLYRIR